MKNNKNDNKTFYIIDGDTGEVRAEIPEGWSVVSPAQRERNKKYYDMLADKARKEEEKRKAIENSKSKHGDFTWFFYKLWEPCDLNISLSSLTRIIFLSTYINYKNVLVYGAHPMNRTQMNRLLGLSKREFINFTNEMQQADILTFTDDKIIISEKVFGRGKLPEIFTKRNNEDYLYAIRLYQKTVRNLYQRATPRSHKTLSYVFQMIPYINRQYNILCYNPLETEVKKIQPMLLNDYCRMVGYNEKNIGRLASNILRPEFTITDGTDTKVESAVRIVLSVRDDNQKIYQVFVNPRVFYAGDSWENIELLCTFG